MTKIQNWKRVFVKDIKIKLVHSKKEFDLYKTTSSIIYLQQASNKLFSVVENYFMLKYRNRVKSYRQLFEMVVHNSKDKMLLIEANQLHRFYYNGELQMQSYEAVELYMRVYNKIKNRVRQYNG